MASLPDENQETYPCEICGRYFVKSSLLKHEPICKKTARSKRKVFDSGVQRATGSDITLENIKNARKEREKLGGTFPRPKTSWREKHETFVTAVSASRQVNYALRTGTPLPPPPKTSTPKALTRDDLEDLVRKYKNSAYRYRKDQPQPFTYYRNYDKDYIKCDYCGRSFNEAAAQRHIPFCKTQHEKKNGPIKLTSSAKTASTNKTVRKTRPQSKATNSGPLSADSRRISTSLTRQGRTPSRKDGDPPAERRPSASSRRTPTPEERTSANRRRELNSSSSKRSSSAPRSSSKSRGQLSNTAPARDEINSSASHRANSRGPASRQSSSGSSRRGNRPAMKKGT